MGNSGAKEIQNCTPHNLEIIANDSAPDTLRPECKASYEWSSSRKLLIRTETFSEPFLNLAEVLGRDQNIGILTAKSQIREHPPHQIGISLTKPPQSITSLKVLTYNTHLFEGSNATLGAVITTVFSGKSLDLGPIAAYQKGLDRVLYDDGNRSIELVKYLRGYGADLIALQEVWSNKMVSFISDSLKDIYPFFWSPEEDTLDLKVSSGLLLLSKFPIGGCTVTKYHDLHGDCSWANKGVLQATVFLPFGGLYLPIRVCVTHAGTNVGGPGLPNMKQLAGTMEGVKYPAILLGDFNVQSHQNQEMNEILQNVGCTDAYKTVHPELGPLANTVDKTQNKLDQFFTAIPGSLNTGADRIDYIYIKQGIGIILVPTKAEVIRDWQYGSDQMDVSDHYPVCCEFQLKMPEEGSCKEEGEIKM